MPQLKRVLSFPVLLLITVNSILGTGIFFLPAIGAKYAGPASLVSWAILSVIGIYISMCFAELASMFPYSGGVYEYTKQAFGRAFSFILGWTTLLAGNITIAMLIVGAIQYLLPFPANIIKIGICLFFILIFNYMAYRGMKTSATMLVAFGIITMITLGLIFVPGLFQFSPSNFSPFFPFAFPMIFVALFYIAETFFGWETTSFLAEETNDPERNVPKALILGTIIIAIISLIFVLASLSTIKWSVFGGSIAPLSDLAKVIYGTKFTDIFTILVYLSIIGSVAGWIVAAPRLILALAKDKLFPAHMSVIHPKHGTPHKAIVFQTIISSILIIVGFGSYQTLLSLLLPMALFMYSVVMLALVVLRYKKPHIIRPYKAPLGKIGPIIIILFNISLIVMWIIYEKGALALFNLGLSFIIVGAPVYLLVNVYYNPKVTQFIKDMMTPFMVIGDFLTTPPSIRKEIISLLGSIKDKKVYEFGCNVGTLTKDLAAKVGNEGKVYATDISLKNLKVTKKRIDKKGHTNVRFLHDDKHFERTHPVIKNVDAIVSIGSISNIQDMKKVLSQMSKILPEAGRICFVEYDKFFGILPNIEWIHDDETIKKFFKEAGFAVRVIRKRYLFWQHIFIYGLKYNPDVPVI